MRDILLGRNHLSAERIGGGNGRRKDGRKVNVVLLRAKVPKVLVPTARAKRKPHRSSEVNLKHTYTHAHTHRRRHTDHGNNAAAAA